MFCLVISDMFTFIEGYGKVESINTFFSVSRLAMDISGRAHMKLGFLREGRPFLCPGGKGAKH